MGRLLATALLLLPFVALSAPGCSEAGGGAAPADAGPSSGPDPRVELGTGKSSFVSIPASGGTLELVAGPQGGWHVDVTVRLYDLRVEGLLLTYEIRRDGEVVSMPRQFELRQRFVVPEGDHYLRAGDFVPFEITSPEEVVGETVEVWVRAETTDGVTVEDARTVTIVDEI